MVAAVHQDLADWITIPGESADPRFTEPTLPAGEWADTDPYDDFEDDDFDDEFDDDFEEDWDDDPLGNEFESEVEEDEDDDFESGEEVGGGDTFSDDEDFDE